MISSFFRFSLFSLSVSSIRKYYLYFKVAKFNCKKTGKISFYEQKSLVGLIPRVITFTLKLNALHWSIVEKPWSFGKPLDWTSGECQALAIRTTVLGCGFESLLMDYSMASHNKMTQFICLQCGVTGVLAKRESLQCAVSPKTDLTAVVNPCSAKTSLVV